MTAASAVAPGFTATLTSEAIKARSLRSTAIGLVVIAVLSVGVGVVMAVVADGAAISATQASSEYSVVFYSSGLVTWAFAYLAAAFVALEFHGTGAATFTATARRPRVLAAKLLVVGGAAAVTGLVVSTLTVAATQGVLAARGIPPLDLTDPGLWRAAVLFVASSMLVQGTIAACLAVVVGSAAGAVAITGVLSLVPVSLAPALGEWFSASVPRWLPGAAVESIAGISAPGSDGYLDAPWALLCVLVWMAVACALAAARLRRTDIDS